MNSDPRNNGVYTNRSSISGWFNISTFCSWWQFFGYSYHDGQFRSAKILPCFEGVTQDTMIFDGFFRAPPPLPQKNEVYFEEQSFPTKLW